jgi:hypothetical protein
MAILQHALITWPIREMSANDRDRKQEPASSIVFDD